MPLVWNNRLQAFEESELPLTYNPAVDAWQDTEGLVYNHELDAWEKVWPEIIYFVKNGVPQAGYTWADTYKGNDGNAGSYSARTDGDYFALSVSGTATAGKMIVFPAIEKAGTLCAEDIAVTATHGNNHVHFGFARVDSAGKTIIYGEVAGGSSGWAYCLPPNSTGGSIDILQNELSAGSCPKLGIYCNNYYGFSGTLQIRNLYFVPN